MQTERLLPIVAHLLCATTVLLPGLLILPITYILLPFLFQKGSRGPLEGKLLPWVATRSKQHGQNLNVALSEGSVIIRRIN